MRFFSVRWLLPFALMPWNALLQAQTSAVGWTGDLTSDSDSCVAMADVMQVLSEWSGAASASLDYDGDGLSACPDLIAVLDAIGSCGDLDSYGNRCAVFGALNYSATATANVACLFPDALPVAALCLEPEPECPSDGPCNGLCTLNYAGFEYSTVEIGGQCWFAENLRTAEFADGTLIPTVPPAGATWQSHNGALQCAYGNDEGQIATYGRLYNGYAVTDARGLCPTGWHVPSDAEFQSLELHLGMSTAVLQVDGWRSGGQGGKMKASSADSPGWNGSNSSGLTAIPAGLRSGVTGNFVQNGVSAYFYTSTPSTLDRLYIRYLYILNDGIYRGPARMTSGYSVRCIQD